MGEQSNGCDVHTVLIRETKNGSRPHPAADVRDTTGEA
jgi:hypothetical protein